MLYITPFRDIYNHPSGIYTTIDQRLYNLWPMILQSGDDACATVCRYLRLMIVTQIEAMRNEQPATIIIVD